MLFLLTNQQTHAPLSLSHTHTGCLSLYVYVYSHRHASKSNPKELIKCSRRCKNLSNSTNDELQSTNQKSVSYSQFNLSGLHYVASSYPGKHDNVKDIISMAKSLLLCVCVWVGVSVWVCVSVYRTLPANQ